MDASMRQKVALTAAHLLCEGRVADMGMGSGSGSFALASLYPELHVTGVDVNPEMVQRASERYQLPNLRFIAGDVAEHCFDAESLEAILNSSVLHHVTSFNGYERGAAADALAVQVRQLATGGVLVVRDFVDPGDATVWLDLPANDFSGAEDSDDPGSASTAALFERFAREFRRLRPRPEDRGFPYRVVAEPDAPPGWRRYECAAVHAVEFVLRKDYRSSWDVEVAEEYTYLTQAGFEETFARLGLRVLASTPIRNPWIVANRFAGRFVLRDTTGAVLDYPATNYVIVGQKAGAEAGVRMGEGPATPPLHYLELSHWRRRDTGVVYDLVRRPGPTVDVMPWFRRGGAIHVLARRSYPRPILGCEPRGTVSVDGSAPVQYSSEPLNVGLRDKPLAQTVEELLGEFAGIGSDNIHTVEPGSTYYPSPGGLQEEVRSVFVEVTPTNVQVRSRNTSGFSTSGSLRALEARQLLRGAQVGALPDARLELNVYDLLLRRESGLGAWIGAGLEVADSGTDFEETSFEALSSRPPRRRFRAAEPDESSGFLQVHCAEFVEYDAGDTEVGRRPLEFVIPASRSFNTIAVCCLRRRGPHLYLGVDDDDLPAAQCFSGHSQILVTPAWRLPHAVVGIGAAERWITERLRVEYGVSGADLVPLGGRYNPSAGVTPEVVHPWAVAVTSERPALRALRWVRLDALVSGRAALHEGHLKIVALRAWHALAG